MDLPQGWKFTPLYEHCPKCGYDLSKEFVCAEDDKHDAKQIECETERLWVSRVSSEDTAREGGICRCENGLQRMVDPLANAKPENAKGNESGWHSGKCLQEAGTSEKKNNDADNHENLVPVIKGQFGKRIIQWLLRAAG